MSATRRPAPRAPRPTATVGRGRGSAAKAQWRERRVSRRRRRTKVLLAVVVGCALMACLGWVVLGSRVLSVQGVTVTGAVRLSEAEVLRAARVPAGQPMLRVDVDAVARRVVAELPPAGAVSVSRRWPSTVHLHLRERIPVAAVPVPDGFVLVDGTGVPFATERAAPAGLGLLRVSDPGADDAATRAGVAVMAGLPAELSALVTAVQVEGPASVVLDLRGGRRAIWGDAGHGEQKAAALQALLLRDEREDEQGETYDVSAPGLVTIRR